MTTMRKPTTGVQPQVFLESDPPPWGARGLAYVLMLLAGAAVIAVIVIHVPETVSSPFVLAPVGGTDPVRAAHEGFLEVRVTDGQSVRQDEILFVIRSDVTGGRSSELASATLEHDGAQASLANAGKKYETQQKADAEEVRRLETRAAALTRRIEGTKKIQALQKVLQSAGRQLAEKECESLKLEVELRRKIRESSQEVSGRADRLSQNRAISEMEFFRIRQEGDRSKVELEQSDRASVAAKMKLEYLEKEHASQQETWQLALDQLEADRQENDASLVKLRHQALVAAEGHAELERSLKEIIEKAAIRIESLRKELTHSQGNQVSVPAPCAGTVLRLQVKATGAFVRTGDVLCELAPGDVELQAELTIPSAGVGRIQAEQSVKLLYDAFPYQRYGVKYGTVRWVSPASVTQHEGPVFRVLADPADRTVRVAGEERPLRAGMGGRAEVVVGRRSLISYVFAPLRQLKENMESGQ